MQTPPLTQDTIDFYHERKLTPIVIYPEFLDNPLKAPFFGRYILNYPGKLNTVYQEREQFSLAYTRSLADCCTQALPDHPAVTDVLFLPTMNLDFCAQQNDSDELQCASCCAGKMVPFPGEPLPVVPAGTAEFLPSERLSPLQVCEFLNTSEATHCCDDIELAIEAQLYGCQAVLSPNEHISGVPQTSLELGSVASCTEQEWSGLESARVIEQTLRYHIGAAPGRVAALAAKWTAMVAAQAYQGTISYPLEPRIVFFDQHVALGPGMEWGASDSPTAPPDPQPVNAVDTTVAAPVRLIAETLLLGGCNGLFKRVARGLIKYGPIRFLQRLYAKTPDGPH